MRCDICGSPEVVVLMTARRRGDMGCRSACQPCIDRLKAGSRMDVYLDGFPQCELSEAVQESLRQLKGDRE